MPASSIARSAAALSSRAGEEGGQVQLITPLHPGPAPPPSVVCRRDGAGMGCQSSPSSSQSRYAALRPSLESACFRRLLRQRIRCARPHARAQSLSVSRVRPVLLSLWIILSALSARLKSDRPRICGRTAVQRMSRRSSARSSTRRVRSRPIVKKAERRAVVRLLDAKPKLREISETKTLLRMHAQAVLAEV